MFRMDWRVLGCIRMHWDASQCIPAGYYIGWGIHTGGLTLLTVVVQDISMYCLTSMLQVHMKNTYTALEDHYSDEDTRAHTSHAHEISDNREYMTVSPPDFPSAARQHPPRIPKSLCVDPQHQRFVEAAHVLPRDAFVTSASALVSHS